MAFLTSFRLVALDAWNRLYYLTLHTSGKGYVLFYIFLVFLGSYYLINLILAVVYMAYEEEVAAVEEELQQMEAEEAERKIRQNTMEDIQRNELQKKQSLNTIPEFKIETCESRRKGSPDKETAWVDHQEIPDKRHTPDEHVRVSNQLSNASNYSYNSHSSKPKMRQRLQNGQMGGGGGGGAAPFGSHLSIRSQLTSNHSNHSKDSPDGAAAPGINASDRWRLLKLKTPQLGKYSRWVIL